MAEVVIDGLHYGRRVAVLEDGTEIPLETLLDCDGDETEDLDDAVVAVAPLPNGKWVTIDLTAFAPHQVH